MEKRKNKIVERFIYNSLTKEGECCPECGANWDGGDIYEELLEAKFNPSHEGHKYYKDMTLKEVIKAAKSYGWSEKTPLRYSKVIGIDMSMDLNATEEESYDGVTYWQCPECLIAWNRWHGERVDKFQKKELERIEKEKAPIIYNAIQTPDGTIISSDHRHDYVTHEDKNGKTYGVDGGRDYLRRIGDTGDCKDLSMTLEPWTPEFHEKARKVVKRGGRGKNGDEPLKWVPICEMNDEWVKNTIEYNIERGLTVKDDWFTNLLNEEIKYRFNNGIKIDA